MPLVRLRWVICVSLLLLHSTNPATVATSDLQTNPAGVATQSLQAHEKETSLLPKAQNNVNNWKNKSAIIIHHLPGLLTRNVGGTFTVKFLDPTKAKTVKKANKKYGRIITDDLCKLSKRIVRAKLKQMKSQMRKQRVRGFLTRMFSSLNFLTPWTHRRNQIALKKIRSLARKCLNQTKHMDLKI